TPGSPRPAAKKPPDPDELAARMLAGEAVSNLTGDFTEPDPQAPGEFREPEAPAKKNPGVQTLPPPQTNHKEHPIGAGDSPDPDPHRTGDFTEKPAAAEVPGDFTEPDRAAPPPRPTGPPGDPNDEFSVGEPAKPTAKGKGVLKPDRTPKVDL